MAHTVPPVERHEAPPATGRLPVRPAWRDRLARAAEAEWGALYRTVRAALARRGPAAIPMALTATALVLLFQAMQHTPAGAALVERLGAVRASQPLWVDLLRTPVSLFVPAPDLPVWGAAAQVLVVFGAAEVVLGRRRTLLVGYAGTLAGTLYARHGVRVGPGHLFGLPQPDAYVRDSGPSAAVVALAIVIAWHYRARLTAVVVAAVMLLEEVLLPNLAGAEHLVAIATAAVLAAALRPVPAPGAAPAAIELAAPQESVRVAV